MEEEHKDRFILKAPYKPTGDQPEAIAQLTDGLLKGDKCQTLLGVTGSGKTFTMANVIANLNSYDFQNQKENTHTCLLRFRPRK